MQILPSMYVLLTRSRRVHGPAVGHGWPCLALSCEAALARGSPLPVPARRAGAHRHAAHNAAHAGSVSDTIGDFMSQQW
jgi:hypothetical protein